MKQQAIEVAPRPTELEALLDEIRRYLDAVELFRREGRKPEWRLECTTTEVLG
jgi:hypothetical protein